MNNKKHILASILMLSALSLSLISCQNKNKNTNSNEDRKEQEEVLLEIDSIHINKDFYNILNVEYDIQFLKSGNAVADSINAIISEQCISGEYNSEIHNTITATIEAKAQEIKAEVIDYIEHDDQAGENIKFHLITNGRFSQDTADTVLVYNYGIEQFTGGAHGTYFPYTLNFSKKTGKLISIKDILNITQEQDILDLMLAKLLKDNDCTTKEELMEKTGILGLGDLYMTENFHLRKDTITFCYGQYEIAPYSSGITYISLGYNTLRKYIK